MKSKLPLVVIVGPTGVGKTELSIHLAHKYDGEVVNGDSLQVYRSLDIGTGKIKPQEMEGVPHHLLDILSVEEDFNASDFKIVASQAIEEIYSRGKFPFLVGGTGLYVEGLLYDLEFGQDGSHDPLVRKQLERELQKQGGQALWNKLKRLDPAAAEKIPLANERRLIRALEVIEVTGEQFSKQDNHRRQVSRYNDLILVLNRDRQVLYNRINQRVVGMVAEGLEEEAELLFNKDTSDKSQVFQSMKGIGYKEWWPYFQGVEAKEDVIQQIQQNSRRYAKRQLTWFRNRFKHTHWLDMDQDLEQVLLESQILIDTLVDKTNQDSCRK